MSTPIRLFLLTLAIAASALWAPASEARPLSESGGFEEADPPDMDELDDLDIEEPDTPDIEEPDLDEPDGDDAADAEPDDVDAEQADNHGGRSGSENDNPGASDRHGSNSSGHGGNSGSDDEDEQGVQAHLSGPMEVERDDQGREFVSGEVLLAGTQADVATAQASGYEVISGVQLGSGDRHIARLLVPRAQSVEASIRQLRALAPNAIVTINTAYRSTQANARRVRGGAPLARRPAGAALVGVIDTGAHLPAHTGVVTAQRGFGSAGYSPREHGSAVVSIVANLGARVQVADVFGPTRAGEPYASASAIVAALQWMVDARVPVINISIEGPRNDVLEDAVRAAIRSGHVVVAAAGNGGPLADPAFPGAYEGVVAVTAVDQRGRAYLRANRGDYVDFAALGVDVRASDGERAISVTGTSFAAPVVAAKIAARLDAPSVTGSVSAVDALRTGAIDRGRPGRDPIYGWGEVRPD